MSSIINAKDTIPERIIMGFLNMLSCALEWLIKACLEKICEHDEDCFV